MMSPRSHNNSINAINDKDRGDAQRCSEATPTVVRKEVRKGPKPALLYLMYPVEDRLVTNFLTQCV
jgi:hypothetical protein